MEFALALAPAVMLIFIVLGGELGHVCTHTYTHTHVGHITRCRSVHQRGLGALLPPVARPRFAHQGRHTSMTDRHTPRHTHHTTPHHTAMMRTEWTDNVRRSVCQRVHGALLPPRPICQSEE